MEGLTESYHYEVAPLGVEVVLVEPGGFLTGYWSKMMSPVDRTRVNGYAPATDVPN